MSHQGYDPGSRRPSHSSSHPPGWNASSNSGPSNGSYTDTPHGDAAVIAQLQQTVTKLRHQYVDLEQRCDDEHARTQRDSDDKYARSQRDFNDRLMQSQQDTQNFLLNLEANFKQQAENANQAPPPPHGRSTLHASNDPRIALQPSVQPTASRPALPSNEVAHLRADLEARQLEDVNRLEVAGTAYRESIQLLVTGFEKRLKESEGLQVVSKQELGAGTAGLEERVSGQQEVVERIEGDVVRMLAALGEVVEVCETITRKVDGELMHHIDQRMKQHIEQGSLATHTRISALETSVTTAKTELELHLQKVNAEFAVVQDEVKQRERIGEDLLVSRLDGVESKMADLSLLLATNDTKYLKHFCNLTAGMLVVNQRHQQILPALRFLVGAVAPPPCPSLQGRP